MRMLFVTRPRTSQASRPVPLVRRRVRSCSAPRLLLAMLACLAVFGCQSERIAKQGTGFHDALVKMYDDQVWDSLIRAKQNKPFVLLNYTELFGQDAEQVSASGGSGKLVPSLFNANNGWFVAGSADRAGVLNF